MLKKEDGCDPDPLYDTFTVFVLMLQGTRRETSLKLKSSIFWNITPRSPLKFNRRLEGTCRLPDDADDMFLRNFGGLSTDYEAFYSRR
jgi:hypothetical protein